MAGGDGEGARDVLDNNLQHLEPSDFGIGVLFGSVAEAIVVGNAETEEIVLWNDAAANIFGYTAEEIVGRPIHTLVPPRLHDDHRAGIQRYAVSGEGPFIGTEMSLDLPAVRNDGSEIEISLTLTPISTQKVVGRFALAIIRDVTYRRELEHELRHVSDRLRELDQLRNDFVAMVAHDLRTPLTVIHGMLSVIQSHGSQIDKEQVEDLIGRCRAAAAQASSLLDDLLTVSQLDNENFAVEPQPLDLGRAVLSAVEAARSAFPNARFVVQSHRDPVFAIADEKRLIQVLNNLLSNAVKFSQEPSTVEVAIQPENDKVVVKVKDEGMGIAIEDQKRIFSKYERALQQDHAVPGSGLGLFISKSLIEAHGGRIWVESKLGEGAVFAFHLPVTRVDAPT